MKRRNSEIVLRDGGTDGLALPPPPPPPPVATERPLDPARAARVRALLDAALAPNTQRAYHLAWSRFGGWCDAHGRVALPCAPETLAAYLAARADAVPAPAFASLQLAIAAIGKVHALAGVEPNPVRDGRVRTLMQGIARTIGRPQAYKDALLAEHVDAICAALGTAPIDVRDRAMIRIAHASAMRRDELVRIRCDHLRREPRGLVIEIPRSKTDQEGRGQRVVVPRAKDPARCPVEALDAWLARANIRDALVFRAFGKDGRLLETGLGGGAFALRLQRGARLAGIALDVGAHSLRAGFVTEARRRGIDALAIARQTRHESLDTLKRYERHDDAWEGNAATQMEGESDGEES